MTRCRRMDEIADRQVRRLLRGSSSWLCLGLWLLLILQARKICEH